MQPNRSGAVGTTGTRGDAPRVSRAPAEASSTPSPSRTGEGASLGTDRQAEQGTGAAASSAGRIQRAAAVKATDNGKRIAEMILECNEDGEESGMLDEDERPVDGSERGYGDGDGDDLDDLDGDGCSGLDSSAMHRRKPIKTRWSASEDSKLKEAVDRHGSGNWKLVSCSPPLSVPDMSLSLLFFLVTSLCVLD